MVLLDLTSCGGSSLAAHAGRVDRFGGDQIQVLVIRDLVKPVPVLKELDVQVLVDLLQRQKRGDTVSAELQDSLDISFTYERPC